MKPIDVCLKCGMRLVVKRQPNVTGDNDIHLLNCFTERQYCHWSNFHLHNLTFDAWSLEKNGEFVKIGDGNHETVLSNEDVHRILFEDKHEFEHLSDFDGTTCKFGLELQMTEWNEE